MGKIIETNEILAQEGTGFKIERAEPPARRGGRARSERNESIKATLMESPGEWFKIAEGEKNDGLAVGIRTGKAASFREGIWKARSTKTENGIDVYAMYVGENEEEVND